MCQVMPAAPRRVGHLFTIGWIAASVVVLAAPLWAANNQDPSTRANQAIVREPAQSDDAARAVPRRRTESSEDRRALDQKPELSDQVKLRVETYTGNEY